MKRRAASVLLATVIMAAVAGCGSAANGSSDASVKDAEESGAETAGEEKSDAGSYSIAIVKQMDHASLDEISDAVCEELDKIAAENDIAIDYEVYSGQGDQSVLTQIGTQVISEPVDAVIPIATLAAQVMVTCAEETKTPVIFAAISDPESAQMTGIDYVTGTSDALNTGFILDMMLTQNPDVQKVGLLYSLSEDNSMAPVAEAREYLDGKGIAYVEKTANTNDEVITAASSLIAEDVDAIFTPTDNVIMSAELAICESLAEAGIPHYTGADSFVRNGAFTTCGVNYTELGHETAALAYEALTSGLDDLDDYYLMDGGIITVNMETAETLGIDYSVFSEMGEIKEVVTTED